jgi:hypothetical protein
LRIRPPNGAVAPLGGGCSAGFGQQHSLAHQALARLEHILAAGGPLRVAESQVVGASRRLKSPAGPVWGPISGLVASQTDPGRNLPGIERRPGSKPPRLIGRAARAGTSKGGGKRWNPKNPGIPPLHREAECDATGSNSRQHFVHTWIGGPMQGKRRRPATLGLIHPPAISGSLTLRAYWGKSPQLAFWI